MRTTVLLAGLVLVAGCGRAAPVGEPGAEPGVVRMFNGVDLAGWRVLDQVFYAEHGKVHVADGRLVLEAGNDLTGIAWTGPMPETNYEVSLEAMRVSGSDFFCGMTFPVGTERCTWIVGGWGGTVVGLSNVDGYNASENATTRPMTFESGRWYRLRLRVTDERIEAFIDDARVIDQARAEHTLGVWLQMDDFRPFGLATWRTCGALRRITLRRYGAGDGAPHGAK